MPRYHNEMFKCVYARVEKKCNATASVIYTTYHVKASQPLLSTINCTVSEYTALWCFIRNCMKV